ncbi:hypothetical protein CC78DRAFT_570180 [Lojkania enalia]|uniref:RNA-dependent RNA polymerase n=1 Tax=Lojkania enalia TaxID=147567 RepID=A0A9P4K602_9PLEO|nr:hypothetical protein CC78DRAFT_570180 [Didymosphaeria enalia]
MYAATKEEISAKVEAMSDFSKLKSVGKKVKPIGLLFSCANMVPELPRVAAKTFEDAKSGDYIFTHECGLISEQLAYSLSRHKGVLTLDLTLRGQIQVRFRESMRRFKDVADHDFSIINFSKPYASGNLNDEAVVLLHTLDISQETLLRKQTQHLQFLGNVS